MPQHDNTAGRSVYDDVRDVREAMADNLAGENARLRRDLGDSRDLLQAKDAAIDDLGGQVERLQARLDTAAAHVEELRGQRDEARRHRDMLIEQLLKVCDQRDAMRPIVEAAEAWRDPFPLTSTFVPGTASAGLVSAVDAWRAAQPDQAAPTDRPSATESQDRGADDGAGTGGSQAQGGAQGAPWSDSPEDIDAARAHLVEPAPTDPAGLDAAIEGIRQYVGSHGYTENGPIANMAAEAFRAAAPHLRAAALNEAADAFEADPFPDIPAAIKRIYAEGLRERAGRQATS